MHFINLKLKVWNMRTEKKCWEKENVIILTLDIK